MNFKKKELRASRQASKIRLAKREDRYPNHEKGESLKREREKVAF